MTEDFDLEAITGTFDTSSIRIYNSYFVSTRIISCIKTTINFCCELGLIRLDRTCSRCRKPCKLVKEKRKEDARFPLTFRCYNRKCILYNRYLSIRSGTFFEGAHIWVQEVILMASIFCFGKYDYESLIYQCNIRDDETLLSTRSISDWLTFFREVCIFAVCDHTNGKIGGPGLVVEVDEAKFGKRKSNVGRIVDGQWVVGGICRETQDVFLVPCPENRRIAICLLNIIQNNINPGSIIITDCWKGYDSLTESGWNHYTVNHSYNFIDPNSGAHTQNIESLWWQVKRSLPDTHTRKDGHLIYHFGEFLYRRKFFTDMPKSLLTFLKHAAELYPPPI
ncbi:hypothetical protein RF11_13263 [Thelohanellus kitauei]|uniref:ISXO2-like transposase domain-containing protein n=1 Tax=Thelohanellus kitauei TaxID=669202 RepID=A0A0C2MZ08_THEKT|nr:hypothetical protein RF11_13263 [Thelohanellus kitauei]